MEIGVLEMVGKSKGATLWVRCSPMTLCVPILSLPEGTMTKVCLLEALV